MKKIPDEVRAYLAKLASKGGKTRAAKYSSEQLSEWAKKGGRPSKKQGRKQDGKA
jgi:hypothetical protein